MSGSPIITEYLHDTPEFASVSHPRVARLMKEMGLRCRTVIIDRGSIQQTDTSLLAFYEQQWGKKRKTA